MPTYEKSRSLIVSNDFDFGVKDRLKRTIGAYASISQVEFIPCDEEHPYGYSFEPGIWFLLSTSATRNGQRYQSGNSSYYRTEEEARKMFKRYADGAQKRAIKREGK